MAIVHTSVYKPQSPLLSGPGRNEQDKQREMHIL